MGVGLDLYRYLSIVGLFVPSLFFLFRWLRALCSKALRIRAMDG